MKKSLIFVGLLAVGIANAQTEEELQGRVGINTQTPKASLDISRHTDLPETRAQGVLFPKFSTAERSLFTNTEVGTMIFNTDKKCLEMYMGVVSGVHQWSCLLDAGVGMGRASFSSVDNTSYVVSLIYNSTQVQGKINNGANKLTIKIPYTNGQGSYNAFTNTQTTAAGQGNDINPLTLTIPQGNFGVTGELTAEISVGGDGEYLVKQMAPGQEYVIATFPVNINGSTTNVVIKGIGGIPDRRFSESANHKFIYIPIEVTGANGYRKTWLNNNLGAEYAKVGGAHFNPLQQATAHNDYKAYGSLFQWQRPSDGHELVTWTSATAGTLTPTTSTLSTNSNWTAGHSNFILGNSSSNYSWVNNTINQDTSKHNLWQVNGANNPCPVGYHIPTKVEWEELHTALGGSNGNTHWANSALKLPAAGWRYGDGGTLSYQSSNGYYWSSEAGSSNFSWNFLFRSSGSHTSSNFYRAYGFSLRCIKD